MIDPDRASCVLVVPMTLDRVEGFHAALDAVARERRWLAMIEAPPLEDVRKFVERTLDRGGAAFVALDGHRVVGWCDVVRRSGPGFEHAGVLGTGLLQEYRGLGIGRRLLEAALAGARDAGIERVELGVWASNDRARKLYERTGFATEGVQRRARLIDGIADDLVLMARLREDPARG
jgi:ribosomal protein S18 acetylase RimI-like enzyme